MPCGRRARRASTGCGRPARTRSCAPRARTSGCRRADGQFRGRPPQHRRRPRRHAGPAAHQRRHRRGEIAQAPALRDLIERAEEERRHLPPDRPRFRRAACIRIRTTPRRSRSCSRDAGVPTVVHAFTDGRDTPPRSAGEDIARLVAALAGRRFRSPRSAAATTPWIATSAGSAWPRPTTRSWRPKARASPMPQAAIADAYAHDLSDEFVRAGA